MPALGLAVGRPSRVIGCAVASLARNGPARRRTSGRHAPCRVCGRPALRRQWRGLVPRPRAASSFFLVRPLRVARQTPQWRDRSLSRPPPLGGCGACAGRRGQLPAPRPGAHAQGGRCSAFNVRNIPFDDSRECWTRLKSTLTPLGSSRFDDNLTGYSFYQRINLRLVTAK